MDIEGADKEDLQVAVITLRALRGWSQADLAAAAGLGASAVSRYESGAQRPGIQTFERIAAAVGLTVPMLVNALLSWVHTARMFMDGRSLIDDLEKVIEESAQSLSLMIATMMRQAIAELNLGPPLPREIEEDDGRAEERWNHLKSLPAEERGFLIEEAQEYQSWPLCVLLCDKSLEAAENGTVAEALELAGLASLMARSSRYPFDFRFRLQGYATAHVGNALRVAGDLETAAETLWRARTFWGDDPPEEPDPLSEARILELEALLQADRSSQEPRSEDSGGS